MRSFRLMLVAIVLSSGLVAAGTAPAQSMTFNPDAKINCTQIERATVRWQISPRLGWWQINRNACGKVTGRIYLGLFR